MRKLLFLILSLTLAVSAEAQSNTFELMKLGMPAALARKVGAAIGDTGQTLTANYSILGNTSDGSDSNFYCVSPGGGTSCGAQTRGSYLYLEGADRGGANAGDVTIGATDDFFVYTSSSGTLALSIDQAQAAVFAGTVTSSRTTDLGWTRVNAANQACNTTCTSACVFGWDTAAAGSLLACTDATADSCLCAGAS